MESDSSFTSYIVNMYGYSAAFGYNLNWILLLNSANWSNVGLYTSRWEKPCFITELSTWFPQVSLIGIISNWDNYLKLMCERRDWHDNY